MTCLDALSAAARTPQRARQTLWNLDHGQPALLIELAREGFERFAEAVEAARRGGSRNSG